jgi:hypothetical protein
MKAFKDRHGDGFIVVVDDRAELLELAIFEA